MDRLVVGDVGFGKTEIAIRAVLREILEGFQVIFLVPTTVLCYQHYYNFTFRFEKYGIKIGQIHRLIKGAKQKETLEAFEKGSLDFLIGTLRILSKDVRPKNLGMIVIDEEQRFGVMQKEKLKKFRANVIS
jgi:transcription-repair coupling factor (superfamily II helicase)